MKREKDWANLGGQGAQRGQCGREFGRWERGLWQECMEEDQDGAYQTFKSFIY